MLSLQRCTRLTRTCISPPLKTTCPHSARALYTLPPCRALYLVLQLYLEDLEAKVIPVERSPPSLSSSLLSWAGTAVNRGPLLLLLNKRLSEKDNVITSALWPGGGAAVLYVSDAPSDLPLVTMTRLPEALLEVVREEGVQHGVDGRVGVLEAVREEDHNHEGVALVETRLLTKIESRLDYRVRQTFCCFPVYWVVQKPRFSKVSYFKFSEVSGFINCFPITHPCETNKNRKPKKNNFVFDIFPEQIFILSNKFSF